MPPYAEYNIVVFWILLKTEEQKACSKSTAISGVTVRSQQEFWLQGRELGKRVGKERWEREVGSNRESEGVLFGSLLGCGEGFF